MAFKTSNDRYFAGGVVEPGAPEFLLAELTDVRTGGYGRWIYCKHCYKNVCPVVSYESIAPYPPTRQALCSECGAGLTSPEPVSS